MASVCCLLVINNLGVHSFDKEDCLDKSIWNLFDKWVIAAPTERYTQVFVENEKVHDVVIESKLPARYVLGIESAKCCANYVFLLHPGYSIWHFDRTNISQQPAYFVKVLDNNNYVTWRRLLVSSEYEYYFDTTTNQLEPKNNSSEDVHLNEAYIRENLANKHVRLQYRIQLDCILNKHSDSLSSSDWSFFIALTYLKMDESSVVQNWFEQFLQTNSQNKIYQSIAFYYKAKINMFDRPANELKMLYQRAIELTPSFVDAYYELARLHVKEKNIDQGINILAAIMKERSPYYIDDTMLKVRVPNFLAKCYELTNNNLEAIRHYNLALNFSYHGYVPSRADDAIKNMHKRRDEAYNLEYPIPAISTLDNNYFKIIVAFWNAKAYLQDCVDSIAKQDYTNYEVIFCDDASSDGGLDCINLDKLSSYNIIISEKRNGPLHNQINSVINYCEDSDIIIILDGDDSLEGCSVLSYLNRVYSATNCWATIGQLKTSENWQFGFARPFLPGENIAEIFETTALRFPMHLRTHRAGLLHRLNEIDPAHNSLKDESGDYFFYASDVAYCRVILSLSGPEKIRYITKVLMNYNVNNPLSVHATKKILQTENCKKISKLAKLNYLSDYQRC